MQHRILLFVLLLVGCADETPYSGPRQDGSVPVPWTPVDASSVEDGDASSDALAKGDGDFDGDGTGGGVTSSGALCGVNDRDDCGPFLICQYALGCVECAADADCPAAASHCLDGTCVGCRPDGKERVDDGGMSDCPANGSACWTEDYQCHSACSSASPCPAPLVCDELSGQCVGCRADGDCGGGHACSPTVHRCVECVTDAQCPSESPRCHVLRGTCTKCLSNVDCGHAAPICDPTTFTCRVGCVSDAQCPDQACDLTRGECTAKPNDAGSSSDASAD